ncbi:MAG: VWA domain-containing protein [Planctomycetota bacterium]
MIWRFESPELLALLAVVPLLVWAMSRPGRRGHMIFSSAGLIEPVPRSIRQRLLWLPDALRVLGLIALIVALARPQTGQGEVRTTTDGVAMMLVVDRSWSMSEVMIDDGREKTRIATVKRVLREFLLGNDRGLDGRMNDMVGLVSFAGLAETMAPVSQNHDTLADLIDTIELASPSAYDAGTAIGEGLALAAARLQRAEESLLEANAGIEDPEFEIKSKVIVLLTDGEENSGQIRANQAAQLAADWGIRVYAIGIGGGQVLRTTSLGQRLVTPRFGFNETQLQRIAKGTDGLYRAVGDGRALEQVYEEIDRLETTSVETIEYTNYDEVFFWPALSGALALALAQLLGATWLRGTT